MTMATMSTSLRLLANRRGELVVAPATTVTLPDGGEVKFAGHYPKSWERRVTEAAAIIHALRQTTDHPEWR